MSALTRKQLLLNPLRFLTVSLTPSLNFNLAEGRFISHILSDSRLCTHSWRQVLDTLESCHVSEGLQVLLWLSTKHFWWNSTWSPPKSPKPHIFMGNAFSHEVTSALFVMLA